MKLKLYVYCLEGCPYSIKVANAINETKVSKSFYKLSWVDGGSKQEYKELLGEKLNMDPYDITFYSFWFICYYWIIKCSKFN